MVDNNESRGSSARYEREAFKYEYKFNKNAISLYMLSLKTQKMKTLWEFLLNFEGIPKK